MKPLNENVLREEDTMPKVDTTLAQLTGATIFSKLGANREFWKIPLTKESSFFNTIWPILRQKMPFGISSAQEVFQCQMKDLSRCIMPCR